MANAVVASWTKSIKEVQKMFDDPVTATVTKLGVDGLLHKLGLATEFVPGGTVLPNAAWKKLVQDVQVTRKLAELCIQAHQQRKTLTVQSITAAILSFWLWKAANQIGASPQSRLAAIVRRQLQELKLLQHMATILTDATDRLTTAAAVAFGESGSRHSSSDSSTAADPQQCADQLHIAVFLAQQVVGVYHGLCGVLSPHPESISLEVALPAAPAAVRLILTTFRTHSRLQQLAGREGTPPPVLLLCSNSIFNSDKSQIGKLFCAAADVAGAIRHDTTGDAPVLSLPGARELLLRTPELVPCLAMAVLVTVLGLDTGAGGTAGSSEADRGATGSTSSSSRNAHGSSPDGSSSSSSHRSAHGSSGAAAGSSTGRRSLQQPTKPALDSSAAAGSRQAGSSSSEKLGNGISLDSLTPLSRGLFGLLGLEEGLLVEVVAGSHFNAALQPDLLGSILGAWDVVLKFQLKHCSTPLANDDGPSISELLLHIETDLLLGLAVHQLTASIPSSYPGANDVRSRAQKLGCTLLRMLWEETSLHVLLVPAAYKGPQLALQVIPSPLLPPLPQPIEPLVQLWQQLQLQRLQQQQLQLHTVTPTSQLLTELLPLLTSYCLATAQPQRQQWQQLLASLQEQLRQGDGDRVHAAGAQIRARSASARVPAHFISTLQAVTCTGPQNDACPMSVMVSMRHVFILLSAAMVPDPKLTAAEVQAAAASTVECSSSDVTYRCVLHAPKAVVQTAGEVVRLCEALMRDVATRLQTAAQLHSDERVVAAAAAAGAAAEAVKQHTASSVASAEERLAWLAQFVGTGINHKVIGDLPHTPSAIALAALSAGPGSDLQQQLFSLLFTMVKLGHTPVGPIAMVQQVSASGSYAEARRRFVSAAVSCTAALVGGAADMQQPRLHPAGGSNSNSPAAAAAAGAAAAAASMLPGLFILGRCCIGLAQQLEPLAGGAGSPLPRERLLVTLEQAAADAELFAAPVQQWLQTSSNLQQLVAAGYAPQALPQQVQELLTALQAARDSAGREQPDAECGRAAAQQLQATGSTLCSFAVPCFCNNPSCSNVSGLSEVGLVSGRSCICGGCRVARYCGRACQRAVWKQHKPICAALAAAEAAGAGAPVPSSADA